MNRKRTKFNKIKKSALMFVCELFSCELITASLFIQLRGNVTSVV